MRNSVMISTMKTAIRFTLITAVLLGVIYPLTVTAFAHIFLRNKADGQLLMRNGHVAGSAIIGQSFTGDAISTAGLRRQAMGMTRPIPAAPIWRHRTGS